METQKLENEHDSEKTDERKSNRPEVVKFDRVFEDFSFDTDFHDGPFPKLVHFIYTGDIEIGWIQWLAVRGALVNLGADEVRIWLDETMEPSGEIWQRILVMERVNVIMVSMPTTVYDIEIPEPANQSDVLRLRILYDQGGMFMETDLVALKSSEDYFADPKTRPTIMARRLIHDSIPNWLIISKPRAPFLKRWMIEYNRAYEEDGWEKLALATASELAQDDSDITILDGHSWFYPLASESGTEGTLKKLWFGKSWPDIERSYGTHIWHWDDLMRQRITPSIVKTIDTPLLCKIRPLFAEFHEDQSIAGENPNCTVAMYEKLDPKNHRLFSDYKIHTDETDMKWVDSSGFHNHGWAPMGTKRIYQNGTIARRFDNNSFAVLPVPIHWDTREWTVRMELKLDSDTLRMTNGFGFFTIRTDSDPDIVMGLRKRRFPWSMMLEIDWRNETRASRKGQFITEEEEEKWVPTRKFRPLEEDFHEIAITYDRRIQGAANLYLDGQRLGTQRYSILGSPRIGQDVWINGVEVAEPELGMHGSIRRFTMYADALTPEAVAQTFRSSQISFSRSRGALQPADGGLRIFVLTILMLFVVFVIRSRMFRARDMSCCFREMFRAHRRWSQGSYSLRV